LTIINLEQEKLEVTGSFSGVRFPYLTLNNKIYIIRDEIMNWLKDAKGREYIDG